MRTPDSRAIMDSLRELDWAPRETRKKAKMIEAAIHQVKQRLGREPSEEEIAAECAFLKPSTNSGSAAFSH